MDKVDEMPAGRDLDRVVAVRVMGQNVYDTPPLYSSDIGAAWEVVEKLREPDFETNRGHRHIILQSIKEGRSGCFVAFTGPRKAHLSNSTMWEASADTFPLAICRAALKTLEESHG